MMVRKLPRIPTNPEVLLWAREYSGFSLQKAAKELAIDLAIDEDYLKELEDGIIEPTPQILKGMVKLYRVSESMLLMPFPPALFSLPTDYRTVGNAPAEPSPDTIRAIRESQELQVLISEILLDEPEFLARPELPVFSLDDFGALSEEEKNSKTERLAEEERQRFDISVEEQASWPLDSAFDFWRARTQSLGILVFERTMPWEDCRGFSLWDDEDNVPVIVVNSEDTSSAKCFTLFHEYAHLILRNTGICLKADDETSKGRIERWCSEFAAAFLMPESEVRRYGLIVRRGIPIEQEWTITQVRRIANHFRVSRPATALRLEKLFLAPKGYYQRNKRDLTAFDKRKRGWGKRRPGWRLRQRLRENGVSAIRVILDANEVGILDDVEAAGVLKVTLDELGQLDADAETERRRYAGL